MAARACALLALASLAALAAAAAAASDVSVVRMALTFEEEHTITVNSSVEYILDFIPSGDEGAYPSRVRARTGGGDVARPVLLTARQRRGAQSWQLPYTVGDERLFELERTLCEDDGLDYLDVPDCGAGGAGDAAPRGQLSLHVASACAAPVRVAVRVAPARDFRLPFARPVVTTITQPAPRAQLYEWAGAQDSVTLEVASRDDVCATVAVTNYTCPVPATRDALQLNGLRMTVQRSGAVQLSRSQFPRGFLVVALVQDTDEACAGVAEPAPDWLWDAAVAPRGAAAAPRAAAPLPRVKDLTIEIRAALSRAQYALAGAATAAVFLAFYAAFGALVLAQRLPRLRRLLRPRAVLAPPQPEEGAGAAPARRRRDSDATYDSNDDSNDDSDSEEEEEVPPRAPASPFATVTFGADAPGTETSVPVSKTSALVLETPATVTDTPATVTDTPAPNTDTPAPNTDTPAPNTDTPAPNTDTPAPNTDTPATVTDTPAPVIETSTPVTETDGAPNNGASPTAGETDLVAQNGAELRVHAAGARPFGLPARLRVAALARRRARTLRARSDRYLHTLATVAVFYALPVVQFVAAFQIVLNVSGSLDLCYYNFLCAHPLGRVSDFNHVFSNLGYLLLGALFLLQLQRRRRRRARAPKHEEYGIPPHYGLLASLGAGMMVVALLSASYHICPNQLNFQFDTAFMYVLAVLSMVKIYQARHADVNARAHATFGVLAVLIALVVWGVLGGGALFWGLWTVLHVFTFLLLSLRIYYVGQFRLDKQWVAQAARGLRGARPLYTARLVMLLIANAANWAFALYGLFTQAADFASHLLSVLLGNTLLYMLFYLVMKVVHGERLRAHAWALLAAAAAAWAPALYFFVYGSSDWAATPARSRHLNHHCKVLEFYDSHDLWHMLSAVALYLSFSAMLAWDDGLSAVHRTQIPVF